jgi:hypothetical protein
MPPHSTHPLPPFQTPSCSEGWRERPRHPLPTAAARVFTFGANCTRASPPQRPPAHPPPSPHLTRVRARRCIWTTLTTVRHGPFTPRIPTTSPTTPPPPVCPPPRKAPDVRIPKPHFPPHGRGRHRLLPRRSMGGGRVRRRPGQPARRGSLRQLPRPRRGPPQRARRARPGAGRRVGGGGPGGPRYVFATPPVALAEQVGSHLPDSSAQSPSSPPPTPRLCRRMVCRWADGVWAACRGVGAVGDGRLFRRAAVAASRASFMDTDGTRRSGEGRGGCVLWRAG